MSHNPRFSEALVNAETNAATALVNGGRLRLYDGAQPAGADAAVTTQNLLAEFTWANPAFGAAVGGAAQANPIPPVNALATGTATWFRALASDGVTAAFDGTVGAVVGSFDLVIDNVALQVGVQVSVVAFSYTNPKQ